MSVRWSLVFPHHKAKALGKASWNESPYLNACVRDRVLGTYQESPLVAMVVLLSWLQLLGSCAQSFWQRPALWRVWWESLDDQVAAHFCSSHVVTGVFGDQAQCLCSPLSAGRRHLPKQRCQQRVGPQGEGHGRDHLPAEQEMNSFCDKRIGSNPTPRRAPSCKHISRFPSFLPPPSSILPPPSLFLPSFFSSFFLPFFPSLLSFLHFLIKQWQDSFLAVSQGVKSLSNLNYFQLNNFLGWGERQSPQWVECLAG